MINVVSILMLVVLIFVFIMIGVPVYASLGVSGLISLIMLQGKLAVGTGVPLLVIPQSIYSGIGYFPLLAIPFFILAGEIMNRGGITDRLIKFALLIIGRMPASLAQANIVASMFFGGITGSAQADTSCIGGVLIPAMEKEGYSKEFSVAVTAASSTCGPIIPPSIMMVIFGVAVNASVGALFMGGLIPGILIGLSEMAVVAIMDRKYHFPRRTEKMPRSEKITVALDGLLPLGMPLIIVGGIIGGVFTPTEAGAASVVYSLFVSMAVLKTVKAKDLIPMLRHTATLSATTLMIISCAKIISYGLTALQMPVLLGNLFMSISDSPYVFLLLVNILLLIMGMFMDGGASVIILAPILTPIAMTLGINPIHFGLVMVLNLVIGCGTPPLGLCLYIACGIAKLPVERGARAILPFIAAEVVVLLLITYLPELVLFFPRLFGYVI